MILHTLPRPLLGLLLVFIGLAGCATRTAVQPEPETKSAETASQRGVAALTKGSYDQAIASFTEVLKLSPNNVEAYHNRGEAYRHKGEYDEALADYTQALALDQYYIDAYVNRGIAYREGKRDYDRAIADYNQA